MMLAKAQRLSGNGEMNHHNSVFLHIVKVLHRKKNVQVEVQVESIFHQIKKLI